MYSKSKLPDLSPQPVERELVIEPWRKTLLDAAAKIRAFGWCQHDFTDGAAVCVLGAIGGPDGMDRRLCEATRRFATHIGRPVYTEMRNGEDGIGGVAAWNDHPSRTKAEVLAALTECAGQP